MTLIEFGDIEHAAYATGATCLRTPVLAAYTETRVPQLLVKAESLQPTGAFKLRGATNAISLLTDEQRAAGVVTHSSGNHGQAVAYAAATAGVRATVVMPEGSVQVKIDATREHGAEVRLVPVAERLAACEEIAERTGANIVPPFDDARVIAGQGTIGLEILQQVPDVEVILAPVGGGGLISGVAAAVKLSRPGVKVIGVEPELAGDLAEGFRAGVRSTWPTEYTVRTVADGLRGGAVGDLNWAHIQAYVDDVITVTEDAIRQAMRDLAANTRLIVEPSGAVATAGFTTYPELMVPGRTVAIVSGGNIASAAFAEVLGS